MQLIETHLMYKYHIYNYDKKRNTQLSQETTEESRALIPQCENWEFKGNNSAFTLFSVLAILQGNQRTLYGRILADKYGRNDRNRRLSFCNSYEKLYLGNNHQRMCVEWKVKYDYECFVP